MYGTECLALTGTAKDYKEHSTNSIDAVFSTYMYNVSVTDCSQEEVKRIICGHI